MNDPQPFDEMVPMAYEEAELLVVIHRNAEGNVFAVHSAMDNDAAAIRCALCEGGARVYMTVEEGGVE